MGAWGSGLYSNDMAEDLRSLVNIALKLPLSVDEIVDLIVEQKQQVALAPDYEEHTTFWLILADLVWKSGERSSRVFKKATSIVDTGQDIEMCRSLGMSDPDLKKRAKALDDLKAKLTTGNEGKKRKTLAKPMVQLFSVGDLLRFPVDQEGRTANPYLPIKHLKSAFTPISNRSCVIVEVGMAFDFFPWYRPLVQLFENGRSINEWVLTNPGTVSKSHMKKMSLGIDGNVALSVVWLASVSQSWAPGDYFAVSDISMSNSLGFADRRSGKTYRRTEWEV